LLAADLLRLYAERLVQQKRFGEAEPYARQAFAIEQQFGTNTASTINVLVSALKGLRKNNAELTDLRTQQLTILRSIHGTNTTRYADALRSAAKELMQSSNYREAEPYAREALATQTRLGVDYPPAFPTLVSILGRLNRTSQMKQMIREQLASLRNDSRLRDRIETADFLNSIAWELDAAKMFEDAANCARGSVALQDRIGSTDLERLTGTLSGLCGILDRGGKSVEAESLHERRLQLLRKLHGDDDARIADALAWMAIVYERNNKFFKSEECAREGLAIQRKLNLNNPSCFIRLCRAFRRQNKNRETEALISEHLALVRETHANNPYALADALKSFADRLVDNYEPARGETLLREVVAMQEKLYTNGSPVLVTTLERLCYTLEKEKKYADAVKVLDQRLQLQRKLDGEDSKGVLDSMGWMVQILSKDGKMAQAAGVLAQKLALQTRLFGRESKEAQESIFWLANIYEEDGKWSESESLRKELLLTNRKLLPEGDPAIARSYARLIWLYAKQDRDNEGLALCRELLFPDKHWGVISDVLVREGVAEKVVACYSDLITNDPTNGLYYLRRGEILARTRRFQEAVPDLWRAVELRPADFLPYRMLAPILIQIEDVPRYRQLCQRMLTQFISTKDAATAENTAKDCALLPSAGVDSDEVAQLAVRALALGEASEYLPWFQLGKALVDYRQGHVSSASEFASKTLEASNQIPERDAAAYLVLALAQAQVSQNKAAGASFNKARELLQPKPQPQKAKIQDLGAFWVDRLFAEILFREAQTLIEGGSAVADASPRQQ
jgi:tetratricopeptide (TPR) repeat protein